MRRSRRDILKLGAAVPAALLIGCNGDKTPETQPACAPKKKKPGTCVICAKCGQVKGSDKCCKEGTEKCSKCGLDKGSPGCCRLNGAKEAVCLCTYCGEIKGSDKCCKPDAMKCTKCGLNMGSPGCCRIKKEEMPTM